MLDEMKNSPQFENSTKLSYLDSFKHTYGVTGYFLFAIFIFVFWTNLKWVIGDLNMYSIMTADEFSKVMSTIIPFDSLTNFVLMMLSGIILFYFFKLNKKALLFSFYYLLSYPILLSIVDFGYSGNVGSVFGILTGGVVIFLIFWHFYKNDIKSFHHFLKKKV